jgi:hypothetical protein
MIFTLLGRYDKYEYAPRPSGECDVKAERGQRSLLSNCGGESRRLRVQIMTLFFIAVISGNLISQTRSDIDWQLKINEWDAHRQQLLYEVDFSQLPSDGAVMSVTSDGAFPLIKGNNPITLPIAAAAEYGAGRIVTYGHHLMFGGTEGNRTYSRQLFINSLKWASGGLPLNKIVVGN